ncbi:MAG: hypothetical protein Q7T53_05700 [Deltaproteobacteria bacterium]|nr:hypothetical protein [Deltaproteobacteria bacterium]
MTLDKILKWVEKELSEDRNDTVHDLLAYLAEQMTEINKAKNDETEGFLKWLERELRVDVESLASKTAIKEYHENSFNQFLDVLKRNKGKISLNLSSRDVQEQLEKHFSESASRLAPIKAGLEATDELIDEIVYRLYGLTEDEINIVKGEKGTSL